MKRHRGGAAETASGVQVHEVKVAATAKPRRVQRAKPTTKRAEPLVERIPGIVGDGAMRPMSGRMLRRLALPVHRADTSSLPLIYPWMADAGVGAKGQFVGHNILGGGSFSYDPWDWYNAGLITNPNGITFGEIGSAKSSEMKTRVARAIEFGRGAFITDPKSEYSELSHWLGYEPIFLGPGETARLNPFDPGPGDPDPVAVQDRQLQMLQALAAGVLRRELTEAEHTMCMIAIAELTGGHLERVRGDDGAELVAPRPGDRLRTPVMPEVVEVMQHPSDASIAELPLTKEELRRGTADLVMACQRMIKGDLAGMFDEATNIDIDPRGRYLCVNLSAVLAKRRAALPLVRICASAWQHAAISGHRMYRYNISDEAWADMTIGTLRWHQAMFKLSRQWLISNWLVMHKPADLLTAGDEGSERDRLAMSLIADAGTVVFYRQKPQQLPLCHDYFGVTPSEAEYLTKLRRGRALWKVLGEKGDRSFLVQHVRSSAEKEFTFTDSAPMADEFDPPGPDPDFDDAAAGEQPDGTERGAA